jgi:hypothetical protein
MLHNKYRIYSRSQAEINAVYVHQTCTDFILFLFSHPHIFIYMLMYSACILSTVGVIVSLL